MSAQIFMFTIQGTPKPQGSMTTSAKSSALWYPPATKDHRNYLIGRLAEQWEYEPFAGAVDLELVFHMPRPKGHFGTGRNAGVLKDSAPRRMTQTPDLDKLVRLVGDALVGAGVIVDDSQIDRTTSSKVWIDKDVRQGSSVIMLDLAQ